MITQYCIYFNPSDFPNKYVLRKWFVTGGMDPVADEFCKISTSLEVIRMFVPKGLVCLLPSKKDDPVIVETWI